MARNVIHRKTWISEPWRENCTSYYSRSVRDFRLAVELQGISPATEDIKEYSMKWKLGRLAGIGVYVHWSFWILPVWILLSTVSDGRGWAAGLSSVIVVFAIFGCVVLHELGHALMARRYGIGTRNITLYPIGGVASLERMPTRPSQELAIALAGPAVNVAIAGAIFAGALLAGLDNLVPEGDVISGSFLSSLMWVNVALAIFNLLPAFPMDGGRVLRAFLAMQMPHVKATTIAARVGQVVAILLGIAGLFSGGTLILVAMFVFLAAQAELTMARMRESRLHAPTILEPAVPPRSAAFDDDRVVDAEIVWLGDVQSDDDGRRSIFIVSDRPEYRQ